MTSTNSNSLLKKFKHGDVVQYGMNQLVYNSKNLPNFRMVKHYGKLRSPYAWNGKVHIQPMTKMDHPSSEHRVHVENIYRKAPKDANLMDRICPKGFTWEKLDYARNEKGVPYPGQGYKSDEVSKKNVTKPKTIITLVDLSKSTRRKKKSNLDEAITKQKKFTNGKTNG